MKRFHPTGAVAETGVFRSYDKLLYEISKCFCRLEDIIFDIAILQLFIFY